MLSPVAYKYLGEMQRMIPATQLFQLGFIFGCLLVKTIHRRSPTQHFQQYYIAKTRFNIFGEIHVRFHVLHLSLHHFCEAQIFSNSREAYAVICLSRCKGAAKGSAQGQEKAKSFVSALSSLL